jgi:Protein of unknown function (DUF2846)
MRHRSIMPWASLLIAAALGGCAAAARPPLALPAAPPDKARLVVYCDNNPVDNPEWTTVSLNGARLGGIGPGNVFYRDLAPGTYDIEVRSEQLYLNQARTLSLGAGTTTFIDVQVVIGWGKSESKPTRPFTLVIVDPATAERAIAPLRLMRG